MLTEVKYYACVLYNDLRYEESINGGMKPPLYTNACTYTPLRERSVKCVHALLDFHHCHSEIAKSIIHHRAVLPYNMARSPHKLSFSTLIFADPLVILAIIFSNRCTFIETSAT